MEFSKQIQTIFEGVFTTFIDKASYSLEESRHAPKREAEAVPEPQTPLPQVFHKAEIKNPLPPSSSPLPTSLQRSVTNATSHTASAKSTKMAPIADIDDTAGFMAAARALASERAAQSTKRAQEAASESGQSAANVFGAGDGFDAPAQDAIAFDDTSQKGDAVGDGDFDKTVTSDFETPKTCFETELPSTDEAVPVSYGAPSVESNVEVPVTEEDRENLTTFKTWGTPVVRDKPASQVRRIIIKGLPSNWATPAKVLSLIHGGLIESVNISASGTAHVLFVAHEACKAFYDKYPNGIDLDREKRQTVFVEMGTEVDVLSSQLSFNLSTGATRVVRAVGVDMNITMGQMLKLSTAGNRKVEKILDHFSPGDARNVLFRFCNIPDAVRFRTTIIREEDWEHCNIQYANDPCELATGYHQD